MNALSGRAEPGEIWRMEHFPYAYVQAIAAAAACDAVRPPADIDSVDFTLKRKTIGTRVRIPRRQAFHAQALDLIFRRLAEGERP